MDGTFAWSTFLSGLTAILAGLLANIAVEHYGLVAPFLLAGVISIVAFLLISLVWDENYGSDRETTKKTRSKNSKDSVLSFFQVAGFIMSSNMDF